MTAGQESISAEQATINPLTLEKATNLLFLSFKFSQGAQSIQELIFQYLHYKNPHWQIDSSLKDQLFKSTNKRIHQFFTESNTNIPALHVHSHHKSINLAGDLNPTDPNGVLNQEIYDMEKIFNSRETENTIGRLAERIMVKDYQYLYLKSNRPHKRNEDTSLPKHAYLSHIFYYGFEGHPTGAKEYDDMFGEITRYLARCNLDYMGVAITGKYESIPYSNLLEVISNIHYSHYPKLQKRSPV